MADSHVELVPAVSHEPESKDNDGSVCQGDNTLGPNGPSTQTCPTSEENEQTSKKAKRVSFPSGTLVSGYMDAPNPWQNG